MSSTTCNSNHAPAADRRPVPGTHQHGFTLIEMIVVLAILGMMLGLIVSRGPMRSQRLDLDGAGRELMGSLRLARARAIAQDRTVLWSVVSRGYGPDGDRSHGLPLDVSVVSAGPVGFAADGSSTGGIVTLRGQGREVAIVVDWLTGRVHLGGSN